MKNDGDWEAKVLLQYGQLSTKQQGHISEPRACFSLGKNDYQEWKQPQKKNLQSGDYSVKETFWP